MKSITGATTGIRALLAAMNGACEMIPVGPMTAEPTPLPMVISVAGLAVARKTLPAISDDAAVLPAPSVGSSQVLSMAPADRDGWSVDQDARRAMLASLPRSTKASERPSWATICPTGLRGMSVQKSKASTGFLLLFRTGMFTLGTKGTLYLTE